MKRRVAINRSSKENCQVVKGGKKDNCEDEL